MLREEMHIKKKPHKVYLFHAVHIRMSHWQTHLPSDHLTIRALLSRVSFPSSSLLARHRIVFSTCDKEQPALECTDKPNPHFIFKRELKDTHLQFQPGSSFFIQHFFILKFILIVLRIKGSKREDSKENSWISCRAATCCWPHFLLGL